MNFHYVRTRTRLGWLATLLTGLLAVIASCSAEAGGPPEPEQTAGAAAHGRFTGRVDGTNASLALLSDGAQIAGYLCDGHDVSVWLQATGTTASEARLVDRDGNPHGTVTITDTAATGTITIDGTDHSFTLEPSAGDAGLYRGYADLGDDGSVEAGWIVLNDGTQTGAITTRTPTGTTLAAAPPLDPDAGSTTLDRIGELAIEHLTDSFVEKIIAR